jgi:magnesium transporter
MMFAYRDAGGKLERLAPGDDPASAIWLDLHRPEAGQVAAVTALGVEVPTLEDMEEIEISARLYREGELDYMTVMLPGMSETRQAMVGPVTFVVGPERLVTIRHHTPRPFETYPDRGSRVGPGCGDPDRLFLSLMEEIVGRLADLLEGAGRGLDTVAAQVYAEGARARAEGMREALQAVGRQGELMSRVRLALLTIERAVSYYGQALAERRRGEALRPVVKGLMRDVQALEVHADFLASRVALTTDTTLGMINLAQAQTIKIFSVLAVVFLPPTLIGTVYGMNFEYMPELGWVLGYPMALGLMLASVFGTYRYFRWKGWL